MLETDQMIIGRRIKEQRISRGLTQEEFADLIGYSDRQVRRFEKDGIDSITIINQIANALGCEKRLLYPLE